MKTILVKISDEKDLIISKIADSSSVSKAEIIAAIIQMTPISILEKEVVAHALSIREKSNKRTWKRKVI